MGLACPQFREGCLAVTLQFARMDVRFDLLVPQSGFIFAEPVAQREDLRRGSF